MQKIQRASAWHLSPTIGMISSMSPSKGIDHCLASTQGKMFLLWALMLAFCPLTSGNPLPLRKHEAQDTSAACISTLQRRQQPTVAITGITTYGVQPRLEIRQLQAKPDQWNIFLLGMSRFQQTDQSNLTSYYQIAGIHGRPYIAWDGVPAAPGQDSPGYCSHVRI